MAQQFTTVVGDSNIAGNNLYNVGNRVQHNFYGSKQDFALTLLETKVAFDALLNSEARYPAPKCHVDTREAAQAVVVNWICRKGEWAGKGIMWMSGAPGVGKSAILQTVCETLNTDDGSKLWLVEFGFSNRKVDGSYFFGKGLGDREKVSFFPATIAYQLCRSRTSYRDAIKKTIKKRSAILSESFTSQFHQLLIKTAKKRWPFQSPITIVIDALDECDKVEDQVELLQLIVEAVNTTNMRFLIASRPEQHIHAFFQQKAVSQHTYHIRLDEESFNTSRDIEVFLRNEFARIRRLKPQFCPPLPNGEDWPGKVVIVQLRDDSDSQFIFPVLVIAYIDTPFYSPDQQLESLLAAPPPHAFSKLDALYERILSRGPPELREGSDGLQDYQTLVKGILATIITWSEPLSAAKIAEVLDKKVRAVQSIILGPMRSLFKFDHNNLDSPIMLCHKSLRDYLLDIERSHRFFVPSGEADTLFIRILSRRPPSDHSYSRDDLRRVLAVMVNWRGRLTLDRIAGVLNVDLPLVESVVHGPAKSLFHVGTNGDIELSTSSLEPFLQDCNRSGEFSTQGSDLDTTFVEILSRPPPSDPLSSYCPDDLLDVLAALVVREGDITKAEIQTSLLGVDTRLVDNVVLGPAWCLFDADSEGIINLSTPLLKPFLQDANRSGAFFIRGRGDPDAIFIRILSRQPLSDPSQSYSQEVLIGVLTVVTTLGDEVKVSHVASFLDVAPSLVEGVIFGPTKALFKVDSVQDIDFSTPSFKDFLLDPNRAGEYFIPNNTPDPLFISTLSRPLPFDPSQSYCRQALMGVLTVVMSLGNRLEVPQIASFLDVAPNLVQGIIFGPTKALFKLDSFEHVEFSAPSFKTFLLDVNRAGEYFTPSNMSDSLFAQILSRQPASNSSQSHIRETLMGVCTVVMALGGGVKMGQIASFLDVAPSLVEGIIHGPTKALFKLDPLQNVQFSATSVTTFLRDSGLAGEYFIPANKLDVLFTQILSSQPPSHPLQSYSRAVLMDVLKELVDRSLGVGIPQIASTIHHDPAAVERVVFGPARVLFHVHSDGGVRLCSQQLAAFLHDAARAGEFCIPRQHLPLIEKADRHA